MSLNQNLLLPETLEDKKNKFNDLTSIPQTLLSSLGITMDDLIANQTWVLRKHNSNCKSVLFTFFQHYSKTIGQMDHTFNSEVWVKMFEQGWFKTRSDIVLGVGDNFFLAVVTILLDQQDCSSLLSMKRKSSSRDRSLSLPMEIITRYDFRLVSSHFYSGTPRKRSTSCLGVCNTPDIVVRSIPSIADDVMIEILSRLPVKSLMRFKSVSKHWMSLIKQDQHLINLHFNHSQSRPNLLYMNPLHQKGLLFTTDYNASLDASKTLRQRISCAGMMVEGGEVEVEAIVSKVKITDDKWFPYNEVLGPVNGLVCFVDTKTSAARVYNLSTREITPWVKSTLLAEEIDKLKGEDNTLRIKTRHSPIYHFGFDPKKKEYKVFCFWRLAARPQHYRLRSWELHDYTRWEVLTVGRDTKWRKINMVPNENNKITVNEVLSPYDIGRHPVYADGTLYWCNKVHSCCGSSWGDPDVIVALDVGSEKFRVISIPNFILDEPREIRFRMPNNMFILGGRVALLYRMEPFVVKLWMLDDGADNKLENCQGNQSNWSAETIQLPFYCDKQVRGSYGVAGSNETIVFECHQYKNESGYYANLISLYSYDRRKKSCKKIEMDGNSVFPLYSSRSLIASFTESLFSF